MEQRHQRLHHLTAALLAALMAASVLLCQACEKAIDEQTDGPVDESQVAVRDTLVATNDTARFYLSGMEMAGLLLADCPDPSVLLVGTRYRVPRKSEVSDVLKNVQLPPDRWRSRQRILCKDDQQDADGATSSYFTYVPGGNVTRAGKHTPYCLLPIRTERKQGSIQIDITIDDAWN